MISVLYVLLMIILGLLLVWWYYGGFQKIHFQEQEAGGEVLVYEALTGDYKNVGTTIDRIYYNLLKQEDVECFRGFGIYYDNPQKVEKSKLRSEVGNILEKPTPDILDQLKPKYQIKTLEKQKFLVTEFPFKGKLSIFLGVMKVYPALNRYIKKHQLSEDGFVMEIYDVKGKRIIYRKQL